MYSKDHEVSVILTATRDGLSNDSTNPADWNGIANKTLPVPENQVGFYRSLDLRHALPVRQGAG